MRETGELLTHPVARVPKQHLGDEEHLICEGGITRKKVDERGTRESTSPNATHLCGECQREVKPDKRCE